MSTTKAQTAEAAKTVKVTLAKPHTHEGVDYQAGQELDVDQVTAKWLADNHVTSATAAADAAKA